MATALLTFATGGCVDPLDDSLKPQPEQPTLTFWIRVPGSMVTTKAAIGEVASISQESKIYDVQVWAFAHDAAGDALPLNYVDKGVTNLPFEHRTTTPRNWDDSYKIQMPMPKEFVLDNADPRVDLYILANWKSIFTVKPPKKQADVPTTLSDVKNLIFGVSSQTSSLPDSYDEFFGTTTPTLTVPTDKGLPISAVYMGDEKDENNNLKNNGVSLKFLQDAYNGTGEPLTNDVFKNQLGVIELERAVAKIRFAFARSTGMNNVQITKIEIGELTEDKKAIVENGGIIPQQTYAFPRIDGTFSLPDAYNGAAIATIGSEDNPLYVVPATPAAGSPDVIAQVDDPEKLRSDWPKNLVESGKAPSAMSAQEYDTYLSTYTSASSTTVYLRESGKAITGLIHYKIGGETKTKPFEMVLDDNDTYTNLHRNHYWTVYAYFLGNGLYIKPVVLDWIDSPLYTYTQRGSAVVAISQKKEVLFGYGWSTSNENDWYGSKVISIVTEYNVSASETMGSWSETAPTDFDTYKYFWTRSKITLRKGTSSFTSYTTPVAKSPKKENDVITATVSGITVEYAIGNDNVTQPTTWMDAASLTVALSSTDPEAYIWTRTLATYTNVSTSETSNDNPVYNCFGVTKTFTEWYFRRQDEEYTNNWDYDWLHSQMVSAPGLNAGGAPIYANRIELRTNGFDVPLRLKLSNPNDFFIVTYNAASADYVSWTVAAQPSGYSEADGALIPIEITSSVQGGTTYFYVVPKKGTEHEGKTTEAYLVTAPTDGSGSQKLPFNAGVFPGSNENTEINFYSVSVGDFKSYYYDAAARQSDNIRPYDKSGEVTI